MALTVQVDWNKNGSYADASENVTTFVRRHAGLSFEYGRDQSTALAPTVAGRGQFTLNNVDKRFNPRNTLSPIYPNLKPARPVRVTRAFGGTTPSDALFPSETLYPDGNDYIVFVGHTDDSPINPDVDAKTVQLSLVDSLADLRGVNISTALYSGISTGEAIDIILDEIGWTGGRDLDRGGTVMPYWWEDGTDAFTAMETLVRCEGPPAMLTMGSDGSLIFKDRHHRLLDAGSVTSQGTWTAGPGTAEPVMNKPFIYDDAWRNIINTGTVSVEVRAAQVMETVWNLDSPLSFTAGETRTYIATGSDPFINAQQPDPAFGDYEIIAGSFASRTLSRTSGQSIVITLVAGGGGCQTSGMSLRAQSVSVVFTQQVSTIDSASVADYGPRSFQGELEFCNPYDAEAVLSTAVELRAQPLPIVNVRFVVGINVNRADAVLARDLSDRVTIVEPETSVNDDFYCESFLHEMTSEYDHAVTIGCEAVPTAGAVTAANVFIIGSAVAGHRIGSGVLAS